MLKGLPSSRHKARTSKEASFPKHPHFCPVASQADLLSLLSWLFPRGLLQRSLGHQKRLQSLQTLRQSQKTFKIQEKKIRGFYSASGTWGILGMGEFHPANETRDFLTTKVFFKPRKLEFPSHRDQHIYL